MSITTKYCSITELQAELVKVITEHLSEDEEPLICCQTKHKSFFDGTSFSTQVITQHKIMGVFSQAKGFPNRLVNRNKYNTKVSSMSLVDIDSIIERDDEFGFTVEIYRQGGNFPDVGCDFESKQSSFKFIEILHDVREKAKQNKNAFGASKPQSKTSSKNII